MFTSAVLRNFQILLLKEKLELHEVKRKSISWKVVFRLLSFFVFNNITVKHVYSAFLWMLQSSSLAWEHNALIIRWGKWAQQVEETYERVWLTNQFCYCVVLCSVPLEMLPTFVLLKDFVSSEGGYSSGNRCALYWAVSNILLDESEIVWVQLTGLEGVRHRHPVLPQSKHEAAAPCCQDLD